MSEVYGDKRGDAAGLEERATVHGLRAPGTRWQFITAQDAASAHLNDSFPLFLGRLIGIRPLFVGIGLPEGHGPGSLEEPTRLQHLIELLGQRVLATGVLPLFDVQDHIVADLH
ncbi:hypothetical protein ACFWDI_08275 [Streptomyces sp. NPDC060064]|uniref:hypothetical protein n=1 Tax=Streptomyces sp. NPDC060064 TaxID=3347049 RepID=UPI003684CCD4